VGDLVYLNEWGNRYGLEDYLGFFGDALWESLHAASLSPSYLNRQAYGFVLRDGGVTLVSQPDLYNTEHDAALSLGIAMLHFDAVTENWSGKPGWNFSPQALELPRDYKVIAHRAV
jgi:hypothetical protein